ncbi:MAG: TolC family protein [Deltaproteobacteria bacterium]|nr:TolC family protein [Deltaproteobacteria bacterium]
MKKVLRSLGASVPLALALLLEAPLALAQDAPSPAAARPSARRISEADAAEIAVRTHPSVTAARHAAVAAEAEHDAATFARLPDLTLSGRYTRLSSIPTRFRTLSLPGPDGADSSFVLPQVLDGWAARAAVAIPLSDAWLSLAAAARAAGEGARAQRLELEATRARIAFEARAAYLGFRRAFGALRIASTALEVATAQLREQQQRVDAGVAPPTSVLGLETARYAAVARLATAEAELGASEARLRTLLGDVAQGEVLTPADDGALDARRAGVGIDENPSVRASLASARAAGARSDAEDLALIPRLSVVFGAEVVAPSPRAFAVSKLVGVPAWDVTVQLEWSLSSLTVGTARRARANAEREVLAARAAEVRRQVDAQRAVAASVEAGARSRVAAAEASARAASKLAETRRAELAAGAATPLDVTTAEAERVQADLEKNDAELAWRLARAELDFVAGWAPRIGAVASRDRVEAAQEDR